MPRSEQCGVCFKALEKICTQRQIYNEHTQRSSSPMSSYNKQWLGSCKYTCLFSMFGSHAPQAPFRAITEQCDPICEHSTGVSADSSCKGWVEHTFWCIFFPLWQVKAACGMISFSFQAPHTRSVGYCCYRKRAFHVLYMERERS